MFCDFRVLSPRYCFWRRNTCLCPRDRNLKTRKSLYLVIKASDGIRDGRNRAFHTQNIGNGGLTGQMVPSGPLVGPGGVMVGLRGVIGHFSSQLSGTFSAIPQRRCGNVPIDMALGSLRCRIVRSASYACFGSSTLVHPQHGIAILSG